jgi:peptidoglycan/xylan/chitin deacetylase (PgdA/CDA1 family)
MKIFGLSKRDLLTHSLELSGVNLLGRAWCRWQGLMVLNYHRLGSSVGCPIDRNLFSCTQETFDQQLRFVKKHFDVIKTSDLARLSSQELLKGRHILLTFDDGYRDNYEIAYPVLKSHGLSGTFFIATGFIDNRLCAWWDEIAWMARNAKHSTFTFEPWFNEAINVEEANLEATINMLIKKYWTLTSDVTRNFLNELANASGAGRCPPEVSTEAWVTWDMLREMVANNQECGAHTVTHPILSKIPEEQWDFEIRESRDRLEQELKMPIISFSYPVGGKSMFNEKLKTKLQEHNIQFGFSFYGQYFHQGQLDHYDVQRVPVHHKFTENYLKSMLTWPQLLS